MHGVEKGLGRCLEHLLIPLTKCNRLRFCSAKTGNNSNWQQTGGSSVEFATDPDLNVIDFGNGSDFYDKMVTKDLHKAIILKKMAIVIEL